MGLRQRIKVILNEALGVPDDIDMIVNIYTDLIIDTIKKDIDNVDSEEVQINVEKYEDEEAFKYKFKISPKESWEYLKNSPLFNLEEWKKFPTFINKINFSLVTFSDGISTKVRQDPKTFFEYWENFFDKRAEEMFRRATRLYDKIKED